MPEHRILMYILTLLYKEIEENNRMGKSRDLFKKIRVPREHFMRSWAG